MNELVKFSINKRKSVAIVEENGVKLIQLQSLPNAVLNLSLDGFNNLCGWERSNTFGKLNEEKSSIPTLSYYIQDLEKGQPIYLSVIKLSEVVGKPVENDPYVVDIRKYHADRFTGEYCHRGWGLCFNLITWNIMVTSTFPQIKEQLDLLDFLEKPIIDPNDSIDIQQAQDPFELVLISSPDSSPTQQMPLEAPIDVIEVRDDIPNESVLAVLQPSQVESLVMKRGRRKRNTKQDCAWLGKCIKMKPAVASKKQKEGGDAVRKLSNLKPEKTKLMTMIMACYAKEMLTVNGENVDENAGAEDRKVIVKLFEKMSKRKNINNVNPYGLYEYCAEHFGADIAYAINHDGGWRELEEEAFKNEVKEAIAKQMEKKRKRNNDNI